MKIIVIMSSKKMGVFFTFNVSCSTAYLVKTHTVHQFCPQFQKMHANDAKASFWFLSLCSASLLFLLLALINSLLM